MDTSKEGGEDENQNQGGAKQKVKSCKGLLYYSAVLKCKAHNPYCVGVSRKLPQVPSLIDGQHDTEASEDSQKLDDFKYACVGYSVYFDGKGPKADGREKREDLPVCVGLKVIVNRVASDPASAHVHVHNKGDGRASAQTQMNGPSYSAGSDVFSRFARSANLVASGVLRNVQRVGTYTKETIYNILSPRRPK